MVGTFIDNIGDRAGADGDVKNVGEQFRGLIHADIGVLVQQNNGRIYSFSILLR
jgi:hypothetical protein